MTDVDQLADVIIENDGERFYARDELDALVAYTKDLEREMEKYEPEGWTTTPAKVLELRERAEAAEARLKQATEALPDGALVMRCASGVASTVEGGALIGAFSRVRAALAGADDQEQT